MTLVPPSRSSHAVVVAAGIALIVAPLVAAIAKSFSLGWMMFVIMGALLVIIPGYVLQLVIAISAFLRRRGAVHTAAGARRAVIAAWLTSIGVVLVGFFFVDGGDMDWGSTFMYLFGMTSDDGAGAVSSVLAWVAGAAWVGGWLWLVVEWIVALSERRRARTVTPAA